MVAKISQGKSIRGILSYNENKVTQGEARLLLSSNFAGEILDMTFVQKLRRFTHLTELNPRSKINAMHISLNFSERDKIGDAQMQQIAISYMEKLGFADQPYLVYRHLDAAHPHLHIATVTIDKQGKRINTHNLAKLKSEPARQQIEIEHELIQAAGQQQKKSQEIKTAAYGKVPARNYLQNTINHLLDNWNFSSLSEYNALLNIYYIHADRGAEGSRMLELGGLVYHHLTSERKMKGVPLKASALYGAPTLKNLERYFQRSKSKRPVMLSSTRANILEANEKYRPATMDQWQTALKQNNITAVLRKNYNGQIYGITYLDHQQKLVVNGSALGKAFSAKAIQQSLIKSPAKINPDLAVDSQTFKQDLSSLLHLQNGHSPELLATLLAPEFCASQPNNSGYRKKKRRPGQAINSRR